MNFSIGDIGGPLKWPDEPTHEGVKEAILSDKFRVGLLVWYIKDEALWKRLTEELGGSFPFEWLAQTKPSHVDFDELRLGIMEKVIGFNTTQLLHCLGINV